MPHFKRSLRTLAFIVTHLPIARMTNNETNEADWKKFRVMVPELRERYLRQRNSELIAILEDESLTATEKFWTASERMEEIGKILRCCLDGHTRSRMRDFLASMYRCRMLGDQDLVGLSDEVREWIARLVEIEKEFGRQAGTSDDD